MNEKIKIFEKYVSDGMTVENMIKSLELIGAPAYDEETLENMKIYSDFLPIMEEYPYTKEQRYLHILWDTIDTVPIGIDCSFSILFRRIIAQKLFKKCGAGFIASPHCTFNFGNRIEVGNNVAWNIGCYIDSKGLVSFGDYVMLAERVMIFSHNHDEENHMKRIYKPVNIEKNAILFCNSTIFSGVTVGEGAKVGAGSIVTKDVPAHKLVAGVPAKEIKDIDFVEGKDYMHYYFNNRAFQTDMPLDDNNN